MAWEAVFTDEFEGVVGRPYRGRTDQRQPQGDPTAAARTSTLSAPADLIHGSWLANLKELRIQHEGRPYRALFIFDPQRNAVLLIGGDKTGNDRWDEQFVPVAEKIYANYLVETNRSA